MHAPRFLALLSLLSSPVFGAPNPWGSFLDWERSCWDCIDVAYGECGGGVASVNTMIGCVCTPTLQSSLARCAATGCTSEEAGKSEDVRQAYCLRYTTTGSWTAKQTGSSDATSQLPATTTTTEDFSVTESETARTPTSSEAASTTGSNIGMHMEVAWSEMLLGAGAAAAMAL